MIDIDTACGTRAGPVSTSHEYLLGMRTTVSPDGDGAFFDLAFTNHRFRLVVPFGDMPNAFAEVRRAQQLMLHRQRLRLDRGADMLLELCQTALRPVHVEMLVDPVSHDRLFIHQFLDHGPIVFRVPPADLVRNLQAINRAMSRQLN